MKLIIAENPAVAKAISVCHTGVCSGCSGLCGKTDILFCFFGEVKQSCQAVEKKNKAYN